MRAAFTLALLALAVAYTMMAFDGLAFLSARGRIGPGFFPRIVGVLLIVACLYSLAIDLRQHGWREPLGRSWRIVAAVAALSGLLVAAIDVLGALAGMLLFMLLSLAVLNRERPWQTVLLGTLLPIAIFVLFRYGLKATMPDGVLGLSI